MKKIVRILSVLIIISMFAGLMAGMTFGDDSIAVDNDSEVFTVETEEDPIVNLAEDPATDPAADPVTDPATDPVTDPSTDPSTDPATDPTTEPATEPTVEPTPAPAPAEVKKWVKSSGYWYYYVNDVKTTGWRQIDGIWYLFDGSGRMLTGWQKRGSTWYFMETSGAMVTGWKKIDGTWYYFKDSGAMATGWVLDGNTWYFMYGSGAMATGWLQRGSTWYYLRGSGAMVTGWMKINGTWYYFKDSGAMATGWVYDGSNWYFMSDSGAMRSGGWLQRGYTWYYLKSSGAMVTGWLKVDGTWYYFKDSGAMATGWVLDGSTWYYCESNGAMQRNTWVRSGSYEYYLESNGAWNPVKVRQIKSLQDYSSSTGYLLYVDCNANNFNVYTGSKGNWKLKYSWKCSTGAGSTKTPKGENKIIYRVYSFSGPDNINPLVYSNPLCYTVYYATGFKEGGYFIHSILYRYGSWDVMDDRLGMDLSHGCIRLAPENARWIYENIPTGTTIVTY